MADVSYQLVAIMIIFLIMFGTLVLLARRYVKIPPNKAMVKYGGKRMGRGHVILKGGGTFIIPIIEDYAFLPLDVLTIPIHYNDLRTKDGKRAVLSTSVQVKTGSDDASLEIAAETLLHKTEDEIKEAAKAQVMLWTLRNAKAWTFEDLKVDRDKLSIEMQGLLAHELKEMGLDVKGYVLKDVLEDDGFDDAKALRTQARELSKALAMIERKLEALERAKAE